MIRFKRDQLIKEWTAGGSMFGIVLQSGSVTYDVVWVGGGTSRYRYSTGRHVDPATEQDLMGDTHTVPHLRNEVKKAREERRRGDGSRRGHVGPSR